MTSRISIVLTISAMLIAGFLPAHVSTTRAQAGRAVWEEVCGMPQTVSLAGVEMRSITAGQRLRQAVARRARQPGSWRDAGAAAHAAGAGYRARASLLDRYYVEVAARPNTLAGS